MDEYKKLKDSVFVLFALVEPKLLDVPENVQPMNVLKTLEVESPRKAQAGLKMFANDIIEMSSHFSQERIAQIDQELLAKGLVSLSELRYRFSKRLIALLKRGEIRNEIEYYMCKGIADNAVLSSEDSEIVERMLASYERNANAGTRNISP